MLARASGSRRGAFAGAPIRVLKVPDGVTPIGAKAFKDCEDLLLVFIQNSVTSIADDAFDRCGLIAFVCAEGSDAEIYVYPHGTPVI